MGKVNFYVIAQLDAELFSRMDPVQQATYVSDNSGQPGALRELYPRAKDNMVRYMIVQNTRDTALADRLFQSLTGDDRFLRLKLLPYISGASQEEAKRVALQSFNDFDTAVNLINHLNPYEAKALLYSVKTLGLPMNNDVMDYLAEALKKEPLTDTDEI